MHRRGERYQLISGYRVTALGTLASRMLGMLRDAATAALLGLSGSGAMDAFVLAFRIPNLFRRLFGEGALAVSYLPVLSVELERDRADAWRLASVLLVRLTVLLIGLVVAGEILLGAVVFSGVGSEEVRLFASLAAIMLPYMLFICLAAQAAATLHALGHFALPALVPTILNICWIAAAVAVAPRFAPDKAAQAHVLAAAILAAGVIQFAIQVPVLRRLGFRFDYDPAAARTGMRKIVHAMGPMMLGLMVTQLNTLMDSLIAWLLAAPAAAERTIAWLGGVDYPMEQGAAAALYFGERLYQFPLGVLGIAVATAIFPLLSRHAARGDRERLAEDLTLGLRLVLFLAIPASVGLMLLAEPLARVLYERREFTAEDTLRTARVIACYSAGVWAYCALPVLVRGYYALGDRITPVRVGATVVGINLVLNLVLIWPMAEAGLAVATALGAGIQALALAAVFSRRVISLDWGRLGATLLRTLPATVAMAVACWAVMQALPPWGGFCGDLAAVLLPFVAGVSVYLAVAWVLRAPELRLLTARRTKS